MKKLLSLSLLALTLCVPALFTACGDDNPAEETDPGTEKTDPDGEETAVIEHPFLYGADISWYTEMKNSGVTWRNADGVATDCPQLMKQIGMDAIRLRVWVDPENKSCNYCDLADTRAKAIAARDAGLAVMVDFHYSDWWADPSRQDMPAAWEGMDVSGLLVNVRQHTAEVLQALSEAGVKVPYVQIGNETRNGMLWPTAQLWTNAGETAQGWKNFATLASGAYQAAKEVYPDALVMVHLNHAYEDNTWWIDRYKQEGGLLDGLALSHYPQADDTSQTWAALNQKAAAQIRAVWNKYGLPVVIAELGVKSSTPALGAQIVKDFMTRLRELNRVGSASSGAAKCPVRAVFYWEPEVYGSWKPESYTQWGWNAYDQGAFTASGAPSAILTEGFFEND